MGGKDEVLPLAAELLALIAAVGGVFLSVDFMATVEDCGFGRGDSVELFEHLLKAFSQT